MKWKDKLIKYLVEELKKDPKWKNTIEKVIRKESIGIHLAVFNQPYLSLVFAGEKKIESRFSINKANPFGKVSKGDIIVTKESGKPVDGVFLAGRVRFLSKLNKQRKADIEREFGKLICTHYDSSFWEYRSKSKHATLIEIQKVKKLHPFECGKSDRSGWSVVKEREITPTLFEEE